MKKFVLAAGLVFSTVSLSAQYVVGQSVEYFYDNAGNRILREPWDNSGPPANKANISGTDSTTPSDEPGLISSSDIDLFPNPTSGDLLVRLREDAISETPQTVMVYSSQGEIIRSKEVEGNQSEIELDLNGLPAGIYFVQLFGDGVNYRKSIVKK